jgi:hypothetical protein
MAVEFHKALNPSVLSQDVAQFVWNTDKAVDNPIFDSDAIFNPSQDVAIVSWASVECTNVAYMFKPNWIVQCIRVPWHRPASEGLVYFMPRDLERGITVAISLRETDLKKLLRSSVWNEMAMYIG